jgi:Xaa-Pro aminopeptidase
MRYQPINKAFFIHNREALVQLLEPNSIALFLSHYTYPMNADATHAFKQNNDLYYLCGIQQEETDLLIHKKHNGEYETYLFIKETNEHIAIWEGEKHSQAEASQLSGINHVFWNTEWNHFLETKMKEVANIYTNSNIHARAEHKLNNREEDYALTLKKQYAHKTFKETAPFMHQLRCIKQEPEIIMTQKACAITHDAFLKTLSKARPGLYEYELEAEILSEFIRQGAEGPAYASIIASGKNACVLHYINNDKVCRDGDLILMDFGANYGGYAADLTRTIPVNGKFSTRQKAVYQATLDILNFATSQLVVGNTFEDYHAASLALIEKKLIDLKLISINSPNRKEEIKKYFMHGLSHFLGLDVHDVGERKGKMQAGMLLTCEPGIYIREEALGIRLENNILITENGPINLMQPIPIEIEEIEEKMK